MKCKSKINLDNGRVCVVELQIGGGLGRDRFAAVGGVREERQFVCR